MTLPKRVDSLVALQLGRWEAASRSPHRRPCIAIANLPGAGGEEVGRLAAERLGYGLFGREIVDEIAHRRQVREELMQGVDERVRGVVERYVADLFADRHFTEADYLREVARAVATLARRGMAVVVGRGSAFLLRPDDALRVLITAPTAFRVERHAKLRGLDRVGAEADLREEDARRIEFVRHHFGARLDDPLAYDLVLNTGVLGFETAASTLVDVLHLRFPQTQGAA